MAKCFVIKLLGEIDNDNLPIYDTFVIHVTPNVANAGNWDARIINFQSPKDIVIRTKDGGNHIAYIERDWTNTEPTNITNKVTVPANTRAGVYMKDDIEYDVLVSGLYSFIYIGAPNGGSTYKDFSFSINQLNNIINLQTLNCSKSYISGDIANLKGLTNLQIFNLGGASQVSGDIADLKGLTNLQIFNLGGASQVSGDISALSGLTNLTSVQLYRTSVSGDISALSSLTNLTDLEIGETQIIGDIKTLADNIAKKNVEHTLLVDFLSRGIIATNTTYDGKACTQGTYTFHFKTDGTYTVK